MNTVGYSVYHDTTGWHWAHTTNTGTDTSPAYPHRRDAYHAIYARHPGEEPAILDVE